MGNRAPGVCPGYSSEQDHPMEWCNLLQYVFSCVGDPLGTSEFQWGIRQKSSGGIQIFHYAEPWKWCWPLNHSLSHTHTHSSHTFTEPRDILLSQLDHLLCPRPILNYCLCIRRVIIFVVFLSISVYFCDILGILMKILDLFSQVEESSPHLVSPTFPLINSHLSLLLSLKVRLYHLPHL